MTFTNDLFSQLPDDSKIWIHVASRVLSSSESNNLSATVVHFSGEWTSHQRPVLSDFILIDDQILVIGAFVSDGDLSGCGIDKHEHILDAFATECDFEWVGPLSITYRTPDGVLQNTTRSEFSKVVLSNKLLDSTPVLDRGISDLTSARSGVERPANQSWHGKHFPFLVASPDGYLD